jgi:hypothetical protein
MGERRGEGRERRKERAIVFDSGDLRVTSK